MTNVLDISLAGSDHSLSSAYLASILPSLAEHYQLSVDDLLRDAGLPVDVLLQSQTMVPLADALKVFLSILAQTGDSGLGFEVGRQVRPRSYQVLGYAILASATLHEAIERLIGFEKLAGNIGVSEMQENGDTVRLRWQCPVTGEPARHLNEAAVTGWITFGRQLLSDAPQPSRVCFTHQAPVDTQRYLDYFQCPVEFSADFNGVEFSAEYLSLPLKSADPGLSEMMQREAKLKMAEYDNHTNLGAVVRREIYLLFVEGEPTLEKVAKRLGLAERTLQSRLRKQGLSFQIIVENLRRTLADIYLLDRRLSLTEISLLLGFSEQSSFTRAFRRWHAENPAQARQRMR
ncbi:MAG: AraC family transcriptional regulator [Alcanivoracaceae bacterium]|nr:AraC family transcriptional regulator [Alcanivoracaceae bacterium]